MRKSLAYEIDGSIMKICIYRKLTPTLINDLTITCGMFIGEFCIKTLIIDSFPEYISADSGINLMYLLYQHMCSKSGHMILFDRSKQVSHFLNSNGNAVLEQIIS